MEMATDDWFNFRDPYSPTTADYWLDIHPKSETQFRRQQFIKGLWVIGSWYSDYLTQKSNEELNARNMELYNVTFDDIEYPHVAGLTSDNVMSSYSRGIEFSKNLFRLYR